MTKAKKKHLEIYLNCEIDYVFSDVSRYDADIAGYTDNSARISEMTLEADYILGMIHAYQNAAPVLHSCSFPVMPLLSKDSTGSTGNQVFAGM